MSKLLSGKDLKKHGICVLLKKSNGGEKEK